MGKNWENLLSIVEFAKYQGVAIKTIKRWIKSGKIPIIKNKGESKYRNSQNYIHYTQLTNTKAQKEFLQDRGLASKEKDNPPKTDQQYLGLTAKQKSRFDQNSHIAKTFSEANQNLPPGRKTAFTKQFAEAHKMSESKLRRITKKYIKDGKESLIPRWNPGIQKRKLKADKETVTFIEKTYMIELGPSILETYQRYCEEFENKRENLFSHTTVADFIKRTFTESERMLARDPDEWKKYHGVYVNRDWDKVRLNEVWFGDQKQIDIACSFKNKVVFPWWSSFLDAKSRAFVSSVLTLSPDRWSVSQAFDNAIGIYGVPEVIYIDRGKPYKSHLIAGGKLKTGKVVKLFQDIEEEPFIGVFREMGCDIFFAYPRNAKEKIIEPAFGIFTDRLRHLPGYRGHSIKHRPLKLEREIKQGKLLTFEQLSKEIDRVIQERNGRCHSVTKKAPNDFYKNFTPKIPSDAIRAFLKMDRHFIKIRNGGVKIKSDFYRGQELWRHSGERVLVTRDPADIRKAAVILDAELLEIVHLEERGHYRSEITLKNRETVAKLNQNIRRERKRLIEHEEEALTNPDPLKTAMSMSQEPKLKPREIRPGSKVTSLHKNEKLSRQVMKELEKSEPDLADIESEAATANKESIFAKYAAISERKKEAPKPRLRLIPREKLTMFTEDEED